MIEQKLSNVLNTFVLIDLETVIFGNDIDEPEFPKSNHYIVNLFLYETKWQLWKNRNNVKFGKESTLTVEKLYEKISSACKEESNLFVKSSNKTNLKRILTPLLKQI